MSVVKDMIKELREKRLWPIAVALLAALVAIPVFLTKSPGSQAVAQLPATPVTAPGATALPAVSVSTKTVHSTLKGSARDPFEQQKLGSGKSSSKGSTTTGTGGSGSTSSTGSGGSKTAGGATTASGSGGSSTGTTTTTGGGSTTTTPSPTPGPPIPTPTPTPTPPGLSATETYQVTLAMTNPQGGVDTTDSVERLSVLPSDKQPLMVELGVLKGGHRVLFLLRPGTVVSGPGTCTPGPIDCEILSLSQEQIESLGTSSASGVDSVALFAVTAIQAHRYGNAATAERMRRAVSPAGSKLLASSNSAALGLFRYETNLGALADLRNLNVGGG